MLQEVFPDGLVAQDGRLKPGDQLVEINGVDMSSASHHQVSIGCGFFLMLSTLFHVASHISIGKILTHFIVSTLV